MGGRHRRGVRRPSSPPTSRRPRPRHGHSVHVVVDGLEAGTEYRYRFRAGEHTSPIGRTRTAPDGVAESVRFAFGSCQNWEAGFWPAHDHLAEEDLDLVLWLGDYIYEGAAGTGGVRQHDGPEPTTLEAYRNRYGLYKGDPALQAAHAARPWLVIWDDHEVENNYAGDSPRTTGPADVVPRTPGGGVPGVVGAHAGPAGPADGPVARRSTAWCAGATCCRCSPSTPGSTASNQPCGGDSDLGEGCPERDDPARHDARRRAGGVAGRARCRARTATWNVLANQVIFSPSPITLGATTVFNLDQWDGYPAARDRVLDILAGTPNAVIVTGDIHASAVADVRRGDEIVAVELVGTSISSTFPEEFIDLFEAAAQTAGAKMADARHRGYVCVHGDRRRRSPPSTGSSSRRLAPTSPVSTASTWVIDAGTPGVRAGWTADEAGIAAYV